jgi:hypothetical protein
MGLSAPRTEIVDTVGAGDAFTATLLVDPGWPALGRSQPARERRGCLRVLTAGGDTADPEALRWTS